MLGANMNKFGQQVRVLLEATEWSHAPFAHKVLDLDTDLPLPLVSEAFNAQRTRRVLNPEGIWLHEHPEWREVWQFFNGADWRNLAVSHFNINQPARTRCHIFADLPGFRHLPHPGVKLVSAILFLDESPSPELLCQGNTAEGAIQVWPKPGRLLVFANSPNSWTAVGQIEKTRKTFQCFLL
jgi:hypothetical protein